MNKARSFAFQSLVKCEKNGAFANLEAEATLRGEDLSPEDRALYRQLFFGVVEKRSPWIIYCLRFAIPL